MEKISKVFVVLLIGLLQFGIAMPFKADAQTSTGVYTVNIATPGTFGQVMLQTVESWSDVVELTVTGQLNSADMAYFSRLQNMTKLDISQVNVTTIAGCSGLISLQEVVLPQSATVIDDNAFNGCYSLSAINLDKIEKIGEKAFYMCESLSGNISLANLKYLGNYAFYHCGSISSVDMPSVLEIGSNTFEMEWGYEENLHLTAVSMPNVRSIGSKAFMNCVGLQSVSIPNCVYLGADISDDYHGYCFYRCESLNSVVLSDELEFIPYGTFSSTSLNSVTLPSGLKAIGCYAFEGAPLTEISIPEGVKTIGEQAFNACPLQTIYLPSTVESIGKNAFYCYADGGRSSSTGDYGNSTVLRDVYCKSVVPIKTTTFNNLTVKEAVLHVPAISLSAYKLDDNWFAFKRVEALDGELSDVSINGAFSIVDLNGLAGNVNLNLTYSEALDTFAHLTVSADARLSLGNYLQRQICEYEYMPDFDVDWEGNVLNRTTLIANSEMRADNVSTKILLPANQWSFISLLMMWRLQV